MEEAGLRGLALVLALMSTTSLLALGRGLVSALRLVRGRGQRRMVGVVEGVLLDRLLQYLGNLQHLGSRGAF
jgi:hypothetical protein